VATWRSLVSMATPSCALTTVPSVSSAMQSLGDLLVGARSADSSTCTSSVHGEVLLLAVDHEAAQLVAHLLDRFSLMPMQVLP
jgi:DTW domain-containing protein YfiP